MTNPLQKCSCGGVSAESHGDGWRCYFCKKPKSTQKKEKSDV